MTNWLDEIRARAQAATPGIWCTSYEAPTYSITADVRLHLDKGWSFGPQICTVDDGDDRRQAWANADFLARARADVPRLLDWIDQLQAEVDNLRSEKDQLRRNLIGGAA